MDYVGIDLHKKESQICILSGGGELSERRIRTEPARFAEVLGERPRARILLEALTDSEWVARCLEGLGHEVVVADPNFAPMYAPRTRKVTTDRRDARALAEACLLGAYGAAHRFSDAQRPVGGRLAVRDALVRTLRLRPDAEPHAGLALGRYELGAAPRSATGRDCHEPTRPWPLAPASAGNHEARQLLCRRRLSPAGAPPAAGTGWSRSRRDRAQSGGRRRGGTDQPRCVRARPPRAAAAARALEPPGRPH